jgi:hypothetical protein
MPAAAIIRMKATVEAAAVIAVGEVVVEGVEASHPRCRNEPHPANLSKHHPRIAKFQVSFSQFAIPRYHAHSTPVPVRRADSQTAPAWRRQRPVTHSHSIFTIVV